MIKWNYEICLSKYGIYQNKNKFLNKKVLWIEDVIETESTNTGDYFKLEILK